MYKLTNIDTVIRTNPNGSETSFGPNNAEWRQYQEWLEEGNTPEPADPSIEPTPLETWEKEIAVTDATIPRYLENLYTNNPDLALDSWTDEKFKAKKELRAKKPS